MASPLLHQAMAVAGGAAIGALMRWGAGLWLNPVWGGFPLGTLAVNVVGGFAIGMALVLLRPLPGDLGWLFAVTGVLGGFTTFSAFSAESLGLLQRGQWGLAAGHAAAHGLGALAAAAAGLVMARRLFDA
jgi:CrcB protein